MDGLRELVDSEERERSITLTLKGYHACTLADSNTEGECSKLRFRVQHIKIAAVKYIGL